MSMPNSFGVQIESGEFWLRPNVVPYCFGETVEARQRRLTTVAAIEGIALASFREGRGES